MSEYYSIPKEDIRNGRFELDGVAWVPERTCTYDYSDEDDRLHCSECGARLVFKFQFVKYCHGCGAKVV